MSAVAFTDLAAGWRSLGKAEVPALTVGREVWLWSTGAIRLARITDVGRTRVTVAFTQKNGRERTKTVPAADVRVPTPSAVRTIAPAWIRRHRDRCTLVIGAEDVAVWGSLPRHTARNAEGKWEWTESWEDNMARNHEHAVAMLNQTCERRPSLVARWA